MVTPSSNLSRSIPWLEFRCQQYRGVFWKAVIYFRKTLHFRCLTEFCIRLCNATGKRMFNAIVRCLFKASVVDIRIIQPVLAVNSLDIFIFTLFTLFIRVLCSPLAGDRSSHTRCSIKIVVLKNFTKFTWKRLCRSLF